MGFTDIFKKCENIICKIGILFGLLIFLFIGINILMSIYTYINMRIRSGNIFERFENKQGDVYTNVMNILKNKNCLAKTNDHLLDLDKYNIGNSEINDCPIVNAKTPFVGILSTSYNCKK